MSNLPAIQEETIGDIADRLQRVQPNLTTGQCVELAFQMAHIPYTSEMVRSITRGKGATEERLPVGTPVSTFLAAPGVLSDHYAGGGTGRPGAGLDHMGTVVGYDKDGNLLLLNQWAGQAPTVSTYKPGDRPGTEHDANQYFAVMDQLGLPAGSWRTTPIGGKCWPISQRIASRVEPGPQ